MNYSRLAFELLTHQGFTADRTGRPPTSGYMVSIYKECEEVRNHHETLAGGAANWIRDYAEKYDDLLQLSNRYIGGWQDGGKCYLDIAVRVDHVQTAVELCQLFGQLAYHDVQKGESVKI